VSSVACGPATLAGSPQLDNGIGYVTMNVLIDNKIVQETHLIADPSLCAKDPGNIGKIPTLVEFGINFAISGPVPIMAMITDRGLSEFEVLLSNEKRQLFERKSLTDQKSYLFAEKAADQSTISLSSSEDCFESNEVPFDEVVGPIRQSISAFQALKIDSTNIVDRPEVRKSLAYVRNALSNPNFGSSIYTANERAKLLSLTRDSGLQVFVVEKLPVVPVPGTTQTGSGLSGWIKDQNGELKPVIFLQIDRWDAQKDDLSRARLIHHELCVITGCESTGEYKKTDQFDKELRTSYTLKLDDPVLCTLMLFDARKSKNGKWVTGAYRGAAAFSSEYYSARAGIATLATENPNRVLRIPYSVGTSGFLKIQVIESDPIAPNDDRIYIQKNGRVLDFQKLIFNPYDEPIENRQAVKDLTLKEKYILRASCEHQEVAQKPINAAEILLHDFTVRSHPISS
jgi:hypothetical protein